MIFENPFQAGQHRYLTFQLEFRDFLERYPAIFEEAANTDQRLAQMQRWVGAHVTHNPVCEKAADTPRKYPPPSVQLWFSKRPLGLWRTDTEGKYAKETGPSLVYGFGPTGAVSVALYPASGDAGSTKESMILLHLGYFTCHQLETFLRKDLADWAAYAHVSSIDGSPTVGEWVRVWWLRQWYPKYENNEHKPPVLPAQLRAAVRLLFGGAVSGVVRFGVALAIGYYFGISI